MRVPHGSTVLVADGGKRLIARNEGDGEAINLQVIGAAEHATPRTSEMVTDHAGRSPAGNGARGGGGGAPTETNNPHQNAEDEFARETAEILRRGVEDGSYEQLIVVAAPRTLGVLRKHFHKMVADRIIGELGKDVTGQPIEQIEKLLLAH
jgi:protein required for attachment to host cells